MNFHKDIAQNRMQEICDKYIAEPIKYGKAIESTQLSSLSCVELIALYFNTEWYIERLSDKTRIETGLEIQLVIYGAIKEYLENNPLYVIYTTATELPFCTEEKTILIYTDKSFADTVADSLNTQYSSQNVKFSVKGIDDKNNFWELMSSCDIKSFSAEGTKLNFDIKYFHKTEAKYPNSELCRIMIYYAQSVRLGLHKEQYDALKNAIVLKLKDNPILIKGKIIENNGTKFLSVFTDNIFFKENKASDKNITRAICKNIYENKSISGMVINPYREHVIVPREIILTVYAYLNTHDLSLTNNAKRVAAECSKCGKLFVAGNLNTNGLCRDCISKSKISLADIPKTEGIQTTKAESQTKNTQTQKTQTPSISFPNNQVFQASTSNYKPNTNRPSISKIESRPHIVNDPANETDYAKWCMICGFISLFVYFVAIITFNNASKAIKQAKSRNQAVSRKVWIGVALSVLSLLSFFAFFVLFVIMD